MINFYSEANFTLQDQDFYIDWISASVEKEDGKIGTINYIFCDDEYLLNINQQHLNHDYYTDIITFDYSEDNVISADIFISIDRVVENSVDYNTMFDLELARVMIHGILHLLGYDDHNEDERIEMRKKENQYLESLNESA